MSRFENINNQTDAAMFFFLHHVYYVILSLPFLLSLPRGHVIIWDRAFHMSQYYAMLCRGVSNYTVSYLVCRAVCHRPFGYAVDYRTILTGMEVCGILSYHANKYGSMP